MRRPSLDRRLPRLVIDDRPPPPSRPLPPVPAPAAPARSLPSPPELPHEVDHNVDNDSPTQFGFSHGLEDDELDWSDCEDDSTSRRPLSIVLEDPDESCGERRRHCATLLVRKSARLEARLRRVLRRIRHATCSAQEAKRRRRLRETATPVERQPLLLLLSVLGNGKAAIQTRCILHFKFNESVSASAKTVYCHMHSRLAGRFPSFMSFLTAATVAIVMPTQRSTALCDVLADLCNVSDMDAASEGRGEPRRMITLATTAAISP
ncbi:hypothetical protein B0H21DRAFT_743512 [Amylocystis lapponica]|nr:hypothetical protein B0H21DRAFT_743512 [Amylocystis lapponica]